MRKLLEIICAAGITLLSITGCGEKRPPAEQPPTAQDAASAYDPELETRVYTLQEKTADDTWQDTEGWTAATEYRVKLFGGIIRGEERYADIKRDAVPYFKEILDDAETNDYTNGRLENRRHHTPMQIRAIVLAMRYLHDSGQRPDPGIITIEDISIAQDIVRRGGGYSELTQSH